MARTDVKKSCGSLPLTLRLVGSAQGLSLALNRAGLMADIRLSERQLHAGNRKR